MQRSAIIIFSLLIGLLSFSLQGNAVLYPTNTPIGESTGGTFQTYFNNMFGSGAIPGDCNDTFEVVAGFDEVGNPICVTPTAVGFSLPGQTLGDTIRYDGSDWIRTNFLYNNGANIGIGTQTPTATLDLNGQIRIRGGSPGVGRLLMSDATGIASWYDPLPSLSGSFWAVGGNTFTATQNFGTISNHVLPIITNNIERMRIDTAGNVGIGTATPGAKLEVGGQIKITGGGVGSGKFLVSDAAGLASWTNVVAATSFSISGSTLGDTLYYNGSDWVRTNNIFHTGGNVGIGTATPGAKLEIAGQIKITGGTPGAGLFLMSDATGLASWQMPVISGIAGGQPNYIARWLTSTTLGTGSIYDDGTNVGIGTTTPGAKLDVFGADAKINSLSVGRGGGNMVTNAVFGYDALVSNLTTEFNTAIGYNTLTASTGGWWNTAVGAGALEFDTSGSFNTAVGGGALSANTTGTNNVAVGNGALQTNISGGGNIALGREALRSNITGTSNTALGAYALYQNSAGDDNTAVGNGALQSSISGGGNVGLGMFAGSNLVAGGNNIAIGANTDFISTGSSDQLNIGNWIYGTSGNIGIGTGTALTARLSVNGQVRITGGSPGLGKILTSDATGLATWTTGFSGSVTASGIVGGTGSQNYLSKFGTGGIGLFVSQLFDNGTNVGIGTATPGAKFDVVGGDARINTIIIGRGGGNSTSNIVLGYNSLLNNTGGANLIALGSNTLEFNTVGDGNVAVGSAALRNNTAGSNNIAIGLDSLRANSTADNNIGIGYRSLFFNTGGYSNVAVGYTTLTNNTTGYYNVAMGVSSLNANTTGYSNVANGHYALSANTTGYANTANGGQALTNNTTGNYNTANGYQSLYNVSTGSQNTALGYYAGRNLVSGSSNIVIGSNIQLPSSTGSNQLNIGDWIYGNSGNIGIGTSSNLTSRLTVAGQVTITGGSPGLGKILTSDANGLASWATGFSGTTTASGITGGTQNYVTKFGTGGNGLVISQIYDTGTGVSIGATGAQSKFEVWSGAVTLVHFRGVGNLGIGTSATRHQTSGTSNVGVGNNALRTLTTGYSNSAFGDSAGYNTTTGFFNSSLGAQALYSNSIGNWNVAIGTQALWTNLDGNYNTALGGQALYANSTNNNNVAIGYQSLRAALSDNNVAIGANAGSGITTGGNNIMIGANIAPQLGNTTSNQLNIGNWIYGNNGRISIGKSTMGSGGYRLDVANGFVNSASGYCINNSCIPNWSGIFDAINGSGNYLPKWNAAGTGLVASRLSDNGTDLSISSGALQQIIITPANQDQYQQVIISTGGVLKKGLTTREKLRIFAVSDYGANNDTVSIQNLCFDNSTNAACRTSAADNPLSNVPNFNSIDSKSYTGGIGEYFPATATRPAMFISYYTGTYMVVNSYTFHNTSFSTSDLGCNVFPYYSLYTNSGSIPNLAKYDVAAPVTFTIKNDTAISNVYSSTNLSLPTQKTTRVGSQFISNVFMTPGQALLMTIGVQSCATRADRSMSLVTNDQRKMTLSITEL